jgi:hypothetical protein
VQKLVKHKPKTAKKLLKKYSGREGGRLEAYATRFQGKI